jgi:hypothetical protein
MPPNLNDKGVVKSELTDEQEKRLVQPAPLTDETSRAIKERIELLEKQATSGT